jgi:hypothetical protein
VFHRSNTTIEKEQEKKDTATTTGQVGQELDPASKAAETEIEVFVEKYKARTKR